LAKEIASHLCPFHSKVLRLDSNSLKYIPNDIGELPNLKELTIHDNHLDPRIFDLVDLDSVLHFFRSQQVPSEYKRLLKQVKKSLTKSYDEIKGEKIVVFKLLLGEARGPFPFDPTANWP